MRTTAASSPSSSPTTSSALGDDGPPAVRPATTASSSPGGILQAQPPPCANWVSRTRAGAVVTATTVAGRPGTRDHVGREVTMRGLLVGTLVLVLVLAGCSADSAEPAATASASTSATATTESPSSTRPQAPGFDQELHDELMAMLERDQSGRTGGPDAEGDARRTARLKEILAEHG